jgi:hypothetical protein
MATTVDCPLRVTIEASAYAPLVGVGWGVVVVPVVVVVVVAVVVVVVLGGGVSDPPRTVAIGAHHPAKASLHVTA